MWELIRQNQRKSIYLFILMGCALLLLGYLTGSYFYYPDGGIIGVFIAAMIWMVLSLISYFKGADILLSISGAQEVKRDVHPQLFNIVEEMKIAGALPVMPKIYIIDSDSPNAFAAGRSPEKASVAVTAGLLSKLNRDELQGVIAHEISHIKNRDILFMTLAGIMLGSIVLISQVFLRGLFFSSRRSRRSSLSDKGGGQAQLVIMVAAIVFAILAPILARLLYLSLSRKREYLADASAVRLTRYPEGLASALEKLSTTTSDMPRANQVTAPMYIVNPLKKKGKKLSNLTSTHPPIDERIRILRSISSGAGFLNYQLAFNKVKKTKTALIPASGLSEKTDVAIREPGKSASPIVKDSKHGVDDLVRAVNQYVFLTCVCGLKMKMPPNFKKQSFPCPRCGREIKLPVAELAALAGIAEATKKVQKPADKTEAQSLEKKIVYKRKSAGWESFACVCGSTQQLSPTFEGKKIVCGNCGREILIESS